MSCVRIPPVIRRPRPHPQRLWCSPQDCQHRFAATGHGDVKSLKDRPGELRLRVGKWQVFFYLEPPDFIRVLGIDNQGEAY